jgi:hypothetical protein
MNNNFRILTLVSNGDNFYVAQIGDVVTDRVGRAIGFKATATSDNYPQYAQADKWVSDNLPPLTN